MNGSMKERLEALKLTVPVMCGYLFLGVAFGVTLSQAGYGALWALMISGLVYAGSLQFVMVPFLVSGASLVSVFLTALMVNARHIFYGVSFIERFKKMGKLRPYMVFSLTDETYSVFCGLRGDESDGLMLRIAAYDHFYWIAGSVAGALLAQGLPFDLTGIDFAMTALFIVICVERVMNREDRLPAAIGAVCSFVCLLLLGPDRFLAPALLLCAAILLALSQAKVGGKEANG